MTDFAPTVTATASRRRMHDHVLRADFGPATAVDTNLDPNDLPPLDDNEMRQQLDAVCCSVSIGALLDSTRKHSTRRIAELPPRSPTTLSNRNYHHGYIRPNKFSLVARE